MEKIIKSKHLNSNYTYNKYKEIKTNKKNGK